MLFKRENTIYPFSFFFEEGSLNKLEQNLNLLHPEELSIYRNYQFEKRKQSYLLGRIATKKALMRHNSTFIPTDFYIKSGVFQQPIVCSTLNYNIKVSIAHSNSIGLAIVFSEEHPAGVDIEKVDVKRLSTIQSSLSSSECAILDSFSIPISVGYTLLWTVKEGLSKIIQTGLTLDFSIMSISDIEPHEDHYVSYFEHFHQYKAYSFFHHEYICSIVFPKNTLFDFQIFNLEFQEIVNALIEQNDY